MAIFEPPESGVAVRMYRQGHGDCYLLAIPNAAENGDPVHVLIDCGYKPGSQKFIDPPTEATDILKHIQESTGKKLDLVIVTHEHQDHVNLFTKKKRNGKTYFGEMDIRNAWFAWTESPSDRLAKKLRRKHGDQLLQLIEARNQLANFSAAGEDDSMVKQLDALLSLEFGGEQDEFDRPAMGTAARDPTQSLNKQGLKLIKDQVGRNVEYLSPGQSLLVPDTKVRAYILGPPRRENLLTDEDPVGSESFPGDRSGSHGLSFGAAIRSDIEQSPPFAVEYSISKRAALARKHFREHYGKSGTGINDEKGTAAADNADWRRVDGDWLNAAGSLALKLNTGVNNTSLVIAFELPESKRVLLFVGDAQRGNWISWDDKPCLVDGTEVTARDLLGRTVLYKVGHHGSHNATLAGEFDDDYPNLSWMGRGKFGEEFVAMINAVNQWAMTKNRPPWRHPLKSIQAALKEKSQGRVFQTDVRKPRKPRDVSRSIWDDFLRRSHFDDLFFDYIVEDDN